ncbi:MAG: ABC transporter ATP-binding protein, partial [Planctomycetota bacterium]|nr:ABC transporter ATP-binding protein [Planctomycetota bacterium]
MPLIEVERFTKVFGETPAVDDLSFQVEGGQILGLVGPNGAGKTTTLRPLAGIFPPTRGALRVAGSDVVKQPLEAKRRLALISDEPHLFESLTVWEHLAFTARIFRVDDWVERAEQLLDELEMTENRPKMADELSRGMRQKVVVACAFLHDPDVLLLDEPL